MKNKILLICGPSGSGKSFLTDKLTKTPLFFKLEQCTTRKKRKCENGSEYRFIDKKYYDSIKKNLIAKTVINDNYYGTIPKFIKDKIGIVIVNKNGLEDFLNFAQDKDIDYFVLGVDSEIKVKRQGRSLDFIKKEKESLIPFVNKWLVRTKTKNIEVDDVKEVLKNFI